MLKIEAPTAPVWEKSGNIWDPQVHVILHQKDEKRIQKILDQYAPFLQAYFLQEMEDSISLELQYSPENIAESFVKEYSRKTS